MTTGCHLDDGLTGAGKTPQAEVLVANDNPKKLAYNGPGCLAFYRIIVGATVCSQPLLLTLPHWQWL